MMESNFYSDEFELLIRKKTEQYKMYPSEKVWKGIHSSLHTKMRWFIGGMFLLITGILFLAGKELISPSGHSQIAKKTGSAPISSRQEQDTKNGEEQLPHVPFNEPVKNRSALASLTRRSDNASENDISSGNTTYKGLTITISNPVISQPDLSEFLSKAINLPAEAPALPVIATRGMTALPALPPAATGENVQTSLTNSAFAYTAKQPRGPIDDKSGSQANRTARRNVSLSRTAADPDISAGTVDDPAGEAVKNSPVNTLSEAMDEQRINWLQDNALFSLQPRPPRGRKHWQIYFSPVVSYRKLSGGDISAYKPAFLQNGPFNPLHPGEAKNYVDHDPALGFEVGGSLLYRATRNLTLKAGLQFNFSRYTIKAYSSDPQRTTFNLASYYGYYLDSITSITSIGNFGGKKELKLNNDFYQLSAPVGFELRVLGNERLQLNVGATIQPTYLLNTNPYLLSSDYMNYAKVPSLFRRWNINGGLEAFLSYKVGGIRWQVGPEFRYQLLSTYSSEYPLRENLKGYGIKIGITKAIP